MLYDTLIVGAGLYGAVTAHELHKRGISCLVIDRRDHIAGNIYSRREHDIEFHCYGPHIFHTSDREVWDYIRQFGEFNHFINTPVALYGEELYNLPFNMNTFARLWNVKTPSEAKAVIEAQQAAERERIAGGDADYEPRNLEEQALLMAGRDIYEKLIKEYTEKQWGRPCTELPAFIIKRLPFRFTFDNNYFNDPYQGIPVEGYTALVERMLEGVPVKLGTDFAAVIRLPEGESDGVHFALGEDRFVRLVYTGRIDEFYGKCYGALEYRSLRFESEYLPEVDNYQGNALVNYTRGDVPYTRILEHKFFTFGRTPEGEVIRGTILTREYPDRYEEGKEPYYPINDEKNTALYARYAQLAREEGYVRFGGRLGLYRYYDMDKVIRAALDDLEQRG